MVRRMTANLALREDLLQEALIHLWLTEARRPGQTKSWYLQSCEYHLLHYLASGRSVDSGKRRNGQLQPVHDSDQGDGFPEEMDCGNSVFASVSARDIISLLSPQLLPQEKAVLHCFADGLGPREIGRKLKMSHTMVIKHRRKIASLFNRLDLPATRQTRINGFPRNGHGKQLSHHCRHEHAALVIAQPQRPRLNGNGHPPATTGHEVRNGHGHLRANGHSTAQLNANGHVNGRKLRP
jgi:DNA-directed RNA polymerase specialized sigma24 family protein